MDFSRCWITAAGTAGRGVRGGAVVARSPLSTVPASHAGQRCLDAEFGRALLFHQLKHCVL